MIQALTVKPLLIALAVLLATQSLSAWYIKKLTGDVASCEANCELRISEGSANRSQVTTNLETESLRAKVTNLEAELKYLQTTAKVINLRHAQSTQLLRDYRKALDEASKTSSDLDRRVDTSRLRALEDAYRVRAEAGRNGAVQGSSAGAAASPLRRPEAQ